MLQNLLKNRKNQCLWSTSQIKKCTVLIGVEAPKYIYMGKIPRLAVDIILVDGNSAAHRVFGRSVGRAAVEHGTLKDVLSDLTKVFLTTA